MRDDISHVCKMCGKEFLGKAIQLYCSNECYQEARAKYIESYKTIRRKRFEKLLAYAKKHDMRNLLAKYRSQNQSNIKVA